MRLPRLYTGKRRWLLFMLVTNGFVQGLSAIAAAWLIMQLFNGLGLRNESSLFLFSSLVLVIATGALLRRRERVDAERLGQHYVKSVRSRLYGRLLAGDPRALGRRRKGAMLLKFVGDVSALRRWISLGAARLLVSGVSVGIAVGALAWMYWPFALGITVVLGGTTGWILWKGAELRSAISDARRYQANLSANVTEKLGSLLTVQAFGQMDWERRVLQRQSGRLMRASIDKAGKIGAMRAVIEMAAGVCVVTVLAAAYLVPPQDLSAGMVAAVISIVGFLVSPLKELGRVQEYWLASQVARRNLQRVSAQVPRLHDRRRAAPVDFREGRIRLERVSLGKSLHEVTVEAPGASRVAILGPNGSGKSTLLGLIGRLYDPSRGQVLIDNVDISGVPLASLRRQIAYVSAEVPLIRGSLRKNLCYGARQIEPEALNRLIRDCELDDLVSRLPGGLDGRIQENGSNLSRGERVRVSLVRALLVKPRILLLDEADAHLDAQAARTLDRVIRSFSGTLLMATHRKSALSICDTFWYLDNGRLTAGDAPDMENSVGENVVPMEKRKPDTRAAA